MPERLRDFPTRRYINPLYLYLYLAEDCQLVPDLSARQLQSADAAICVARHTSNIFGDRCFAAAGPRLDIAANQSKTMSQSGTIQAFVKDVKDIPV